jgi:hypothetical protein
MKRILWSFALLAVFISSAAVSYAATSAVTLEQLLEKTSKVKSLEYSMNISADIVEYPDAVNYKISSKGKSIFGTSASHSLQTNVELSGNYPSTDSYFSNTSMSKYSATVGLDTVYTKNTLYFAIKKFSLLPAADQDMFVPVFKKIKNIWIKISDEEINGLTESDLYDTDDISFTEAMQQLDDAGVFTFVRQADQAKISGKTTQHYVFTVNKTALINFLITEFEALNGRKPSAQESNDIRTEINSITLSPADVWVDEATMLPMKYAGNIGVKDGSMNMTVKADLTISKFNSVKSIKAPKKSKGLEDVLGSLFGDWE